MGLRLRVGLRPDATKILSFRGGGAALVTRIRIVFAGGGFEWAALVNSLTR